MISLEEKENIKKSFNFDKFFNKRQEDLIYDEAIDDANLYTTMDEPDSGNSEVTPELLKRVAEDLGDFYRRVRKEE